MSTQGSNNSSNSNNNCRGACALGESLKGKEIKLASTQGVRLAFRLTQGSTTSFRERTTLPRTIPTILTLGSLGAFTIARDLVDNITLSDRG